jgi:hypothetical protein
MTAITTSTPVGVDPLGCHIHLYNKRNPTKSNGTDAYASAHLNKSNKPSVLYDLPVAGLVARGNSTSSGRWYKLVQTPFIPALDP